MSRGLGNASYFSPPAIARDQLFSEKGREFSRKVRTLTGKLPVAAASPHGCFRLQTLYYSGSSAISSYAFSSRCCLFDARGFGTVDRPILQRSLLDPDAVLHSGHSSDP